MPTYYQELRTELAHIEAIGGVIDDLAIAEDVQREIIDEMVNGAKSDCTMSLKSMQEQPYLYALTSLDGHRVRPAPAGTGVAIKYH